MPRIDKIEIALLVAAVAVFCAGAVEVLDNVSSLPTVFQSAATQECVRVYTPSEKPLYSCENMPTRYHHVWVE